jgi:hypothetical protein
MIAYTLGKSIVMHSSWLLKTIEAYACAYIKLRLNKVNS